MNTLTARRPRPCHERAGDDETNAPAENGHHPTHSTTPLGPVVLYAERGQESADECASSPKPAPRHLPTTREPGPASSVPEKSRAVFGAECDICGHE